MNDSDKFDSIKEENATWNDLKVFDETFTIQNDSFLTFSPTNISVEDTLLEPHFNDLDTRFNELFQRKLPDSSLEIIAPTSEKKFSSVETEYQHILDIKPISYTILNLDPQKELKIKTEDIRGQIFTHTFQKPSTPNKPESEKSLQASVSIEECYKNIFTEDLIICDVTIDNEKFLEVWNLVKALKTYLGDVHKSGESIPKKTFILISSLMTWADTPEIMTESEFKLHEYQSEFRKYHIKYKHYYILENEVTQLGRQYSDLIRTLIIGIGLTYGKGEKHLTSTIKMALNKDFPLVVFDDAPVYVPVIHVDDLTSLVNSLIYRFPENYEYIFGAECTYTQKTILNSLKTLCGNRHEIKTVSKKYFNFYELEGETDIFYSCLPVQPSYQDLIHWKAEHNLICSLPSLIEDYLSSKREKNTSIIILGSSSRRTTIAEELSKIIDVPCFNPKKAMEKYMDGKDTLLKRALENSVNKYTSLPRGKLLLKVLDQLFQEPEIRQKGYILEGFPNTYKEAKLLMKLFSYNMEKYEQKLRTEEDYNLSLTPDHLIVLMSRDSEVNRETYFTTSTSMIRSEAYRSNIGQETSAIQYFDEIGIIPVLFDLDETFDDKELAAYISNFINKPQSPSEHLNPVNDSSRSMSENTLDLMYSKPDSKVDLINSQMTETRFECMKGSLGTEGLLVEVDTLWNSNQNFSKIQVFTKVDEPEVEASNIKNEISKVDLSKQNISLKFPIEVEEFEFKTAELSPIYKKGTVLDHKGKNKRLMGKVSQNFQKSMEVESSKELVGKPKGVKESHQKILQTNGESQEAKRDKFHVKPILRAQSFIPEIDWEIVNDKMVLGKVVSWYRPIVCKSKKVQIISEPVGEEKEERQARHRSISNFSVYDASESESVATLFNQVYNVDGSGDLNITSVGGYKANNRLERIALEGRIDRMGSVKELNMSEDETGMQSPSTLSALTVYDPEVYRDVIWLNENKDNLIRAAPLYKKTEGGRYHHYNFFLDISKNYAVQSTPCSPEIMKSINRCLGEVSDMETKIIAPCVKKIEDVEIKALKAKVKHPEIKVGKIVQKTFCNQDLNKEVFEPSEALENLQKIEDVQKSSVQQIQSEFYPSQDYYHVYSCSDQIYNFQTAMDDSDELTNEEIPLRASKTSSQTQIRSILKKGNKKPPFPRTKVRFSAEEDFILTFEEKFSAWLESHLEEENKINLLKKISVGCSEDGKYGCLKTLYNNLFTGSNNGWSNDAIRKLIFSQRERSMSGFTNQEILFYREKLLNYDELKFYLLRHWSHFRINPPKLSVLPTSIMLQIERKYICDLVKIHHKKNMEQMNKQMSNTIHCPCALKLLGKEAAYTSESFHSDRAGEIKSIDSQSIPEAFNFEFGGTQEVSDPGHIDEKFEMLPSLLLNCKKNELEDSSENNILLKSTEPVSVKFRSSLK